jgi:AraC-like DNA-binding protein
MNILKPSTPLSPYIKSYIIVESNNELLNRVLPDTCVILAIRYKGTVEYVHNERYDFLPTFTISGLRKSPRLIHYAKDTGNILVQFKEAGAAAFFREPLHEFYNSIVALDTFIDRPGISQLEERIQCAATPDQRIRVIEEFLLSRLKSYQPDLLIGQAVEKLQFSGGLLKIKDLAFSLNISHDAFEKKFRRAVGATPKQFASLVRMRSVIKERGLDRPFIGTALNAGFFDQAHFIKEFKQFTGQTPTDFFNVPPLW